MGFGCDANSLDKQDGVEVKIIANFTLLRYLDPGEPESVFWGGALYARIGQRPPKPRLIWAFCEQLDTAFKDATLRNNVYDGVADGAPEVFTVER